MGAATATYKDGVTQIFNPSNSRAGLSIGSILSDPSTMNNGDLWYATTDHTVRVRINGAVESLASKEWVATQGYGNAQADEVVLLDGSAPMTGTLSFSGTTHPGLRLNQLTTTQQNAMTPLSGYFIGNTTIGLPSYYNGTTWVTIGAGGTGLSAADLAGGTALSVNVAYFDTISANRTFSALPAGSDGDKITLTFDVTGSTRVLDFHTSSTVYRVGESGVLASCVSFPVGSHSLSLTKADGKWWLIDSGTITESLPATSITLADTEGIFSASTVEDALLEASKVVTKVTSASYTVGTTNPRELYGGIIYVTAAATITIPAVASGASFTVKTIGSVAVSVDPNASDLIYLDGLALSDGDKVTNTSTAGDIAVFTYYDSTGWDCSSNGWTDGN